MPEDYHCVWKLGHLVSTSETLPLQNPSCPKACVWRCLAPWSTAAGISPGSSLVPSTLSPLHLFLLCFVCFCDQALLLTQVCLKCKLLLPHPPYSWDCRCVLPCPDNRICFPDDSSSQGCTQVCLQFLLSVLLVTWWFPNSKTHATFCCCLFSFETGPTLPRLALNLPCVRGWPRTAHFLSQCWDYRCAPL